MKSVTKPIGRVIAIALVITTLFICAVPALAASTSSTRIVNFASTTKIEAKTTKYTITNSNPLFKKSVKININTPLNQKAYRTFLEKNAVFSVVVYDKTHASVYSYKDLKAGSTIKLPAKSTCQVTVISYIYNFGNGTNQTAYDSATYGKYWLTY